uniref:Uncharacterized protein n=1 Tax=Papio anubis TaxID=9555 RepID=A0A096NXE2_PAPAN
MYCYVLCLLSPSRFLLCFVFVFPHHLRLCLRLSEGCREKGYQDWKRSYSKDPGFSLVNTVKAGMIISFPSNNIYPSVCCYQSEIFKHEFSNSKKSSWIQEERHLGRNNVLYSAQDVSPEKVTSALNKQTNNN